MSHQVVLDTTCSWRLADAIKTGTTAALNRLKSLAERGNREDFLRVPDKAPDIEPDDYARL
jgi:hypothetical protein